jgi:hypothetical protein
MKKTNEPPKNQPVLQPTVVSVPDQKWVDRVPITELAGAQNIAQQMNQANQEMNKRIEETKLPVNDLLGIKK